MKKYLVKITSVATKENPIFAGEIDINYYGRGESHIAHEGNHGDGIYRIGKLEDINSYWIEKDGYNRECDAKRSYMYKNPENTKYWKSTAEIITVEI